MKKFIVAIIILVLLYLTSYLFLGGFIIGYKNNHLIVNSFACADVCPQNGSWYKKYYGKISYDQCLSMGGLPKFVGFIPLDDKGKPVSGVGYDGCQVK